MGKKKLRYRYLSVALTDKGKFRINNQDSLIVKHSVYNRHELLMAIVCDGVGGLSKGELASATLIREFNDWFDNKLPDIINKHDINFIADNLVKLLNDVNKKIRLYSKNKKIKMGSTFTMILFLDSRYLILHIGDSCIYYLANKSLVQLTEAHNLVSCIKSIDENEIIKEKRKNILSQCVGITKCLRPQKSLEMIQKGLYILCSDGLKHQIHYNDLIEILELHDYKIKKNISKIALNAIKVARLRGEKDNISIIIINVY